MNRLFVQPRPARSLAEATEAELVAAARARDEAAVRELIRRMNPRLFRVARGIVASDAEAEEVVQEAYLAAFTRLDTFRAEASFSTWVTRIALNAAMTRRRRTRPHEEYDTVAEANAPTDTVLPFPGTDQPDAALGRRQVRELLERAVAELPPELRLVFLLREAEGMSTLAIARDLSLDPITVKTRLFRARLRLRRSIERRLRGGFDAIFPFGGTRCAAMADRVLAALGLGETAPWDRMPLRPPAAAIGDLRHSACFDELTLPGDRLTWNNVDDRRPAQVFTSRASARPGGVSPRASRAARDSCKSDPIL